MRVAERIDLDVATERELQALSKRRRVEARLQQRARVILLAAAQGWQNKEIASEVDLDRRQVVLWRSRFLQGGIDALRQDAPRRTPTVTPQLESKIMQVTLAQQARGGDALEHAHVGRAPGAERHHDSPRVAAQRHQAALDAHLQALARSSLL